MRFDVSADEMCRNRSSISSVPWGDDSIPEAPCNLEFSLDGTANDMSMPEAVVEQDVDCFLMVHKKKNIKCAMQGKVVTGEIDFLVHGKK